MCDALVCTDCEEGRLMPLNMNAGAEWVCGTCYASQGADKVKQATATQNGQIVTQSGNSANLHIIDEASVGSTDTPKCYTFLKRYLKGL